MNEESITSKVKIETSSY